jgi:hypothetical protein
VRLFGVGEEVGGERVVGKEEVGGRREGFEA